MLANYSNMFRDDKYKNFREYADNIKVYFDIIYNLNKRKLQMNKFKGLQVKIKNKEYILTDQLGEGGFSFIYNTNRVDVICKIQIISMKEIEKSYNNQKDLLSKLSHPNIIKLVDSIEMTIRNDKVGLLLLQNCSKGNAFNLIERSKDSIEQKIVIKIFDSVISALQVIHLNGISHRDIKLENILQTKNGQYKLCDFGSATSNIVNSINNINRVQVEQDIEKNTTPIYRSPEQLDLYSNFVIGPKVDIFALGCAIFMICFKKPPFQSRLASINKQYFIPQNSIYSKQLINLIIKCFETNPELRPSASKLKSYLNDIITMHRRKFSKNGFNTEAEYKITINQLNRIKEITEVTEENVEIGIMDKIKKIYNQITTETEGWILSFIQQNQQAPPVQYNRFIISKCWEKRYKIDKVYQIINKETDNNLEKSVVILKILILVHNFLRKGPIEALNDQLQISGQTICVKIYNFWKSINIKDKSMDKKRNLFIALLIRNYSLILLQKVKICSFYSKYIEGNYSLVPFFSNGSNKKILNLDFISDLLNFLQKLITFHQKIQSIGYLIEIQRSIILSLVDEQYCLVSTFVHVYATFKQATNYITQSINQESLMKKMKDIDIKFENVYTRLNKQLQKAYKFSSLFAQNQFCLNLQVIQYIKNIEILKKKTKFNIKTFLNYNVNIYGLKIPLTYEQVIKNPNFIKQLMMRQNEFNSTNDMKFIEINEFKQIYNKSEKNLTFMNKKNSKQQKKVQQFHSLNGSIFQNFQFPSNNSNKEIIKESINKPFQSILPNVQMMEFTHQNLNKDFITQSNAEQFKDFLSIAQSQKEQEKTFKQSIQRVQMFDFFEETKLQNKIEIPLRSQGNQTSQVFQQKSLIDIEKPPPSALPEKNQENPKKEELDFFKDFIMIPNNSDSLDLKHFILGEVTKNANQYIIQFQQIKIIKMIGVGHSSQVYCGYWRGQEVAIKKIKAKLTNPNLIKQFQRQIITCVKMRPHPNIVTLIGVSQHQGNFYIINQLCYGGTLFQLLHENKIFISWKSKISIAMQIAQGMLFLHTNIPPTIHRDMKSLNVLISFPYRQESDRLQIKIADFGLSRDMSSRYMTGILGTYHWMAPQIFNNQNYTIKADVYSYAIVLWEIIVRQTPYKNIQTPQALMKYVTIENGRPDLSIISQDCPVELKLLMMRCWDGDYERRPDFRQIIEILNSIII